jgi:hypothetical protein
LKLDVGKDHAIALAGAAAVVAGLAIALGWEGFRLGLGGAIALGGLGAFLAHGVRALEAGLARGPDDGPEIGPGA